MLSPVVNNVVSAPVVVGKAEVNLVPTASVVEGNVVSGVVLVVVETVGKIKFKLIC